MGDSFNILFGTRTVVSLVFFSHLDDSCHSTPRPPGSFYLGHGGYMLFCFVGFFVVNPNGMTRSRSRSRSRLGCVRSEVGIVQHSFDGDGLSR